MSSESNGVCPAGGQQELTNLASPKENYIVEDEVLEDELVNDDLEISRSQVRITWYDFFFFFSFTLSVCR